MSDWEIKYDNDTGPEDDYLEEWWEVFSVSQNRSFRCDFKRDAEWLLVTLNSIAIDDGK